MLNLQINLNKQLLRILIASMRQETIYPLQAFLDDNPSHLVTHNHKQTSSHSNQLPVKLTVLTDTESPARQSFKKTIEPPTKIAKHYKKLQKGTTLKINGLIIILTKREDQCLSLFIKGHSADEIARLLHLSKRTVQTYAENIKNKFGCKKIIEVFYLLAKYHHLDKFIE